MKLWQGWHNTDQDRPYFHYGPLGVRRTDGDTVTKTCKRKHEVRNEKAEWEFFNLIVEKYVVILSFKFVKKQFLNVMFKSVDASS